MVELNLEEIKKKLNFRITWYPSLFSTYEWTEYHDNTEGKEYVNKPIFSPHILPNVSIIGSEAAIGTVCFGRFTRHYPRRNSVGDKIWFKLRMFKEPKDYDKKSNFTNIDNFCWANKEQIEFWLNTCKEESGIPFDYIVKEEEGNPDCYTITFDFYNLNMVKIKYVLFWTRYLYELPASMHVLDAMILKRDYYPDESMINLLTLVSTVNSVNRFRMGSSQCLTDCGRFLSLEKLQRLLKTESYYVSNIFSCGFYHQYLCSPDNPNCNVLVLRNRETDDRVPIDPFLTENNMEKNFFDPVSNWISREDRFQRYMPIYDFLKKHQDL